MEGRFFIFCCGNKSLYSKKCRETNYEKDICNQCHINNCKEWYMFGFKDAKKGKKPEFKKEDLK